MYSILNKAIETPPTFRTGADARPPHAAFLVADADSESHRLDSAPTLVSLTESKASWAGSDAFEIRWTSLAA